MSELRWNPVLEEWVITATHRQDRTFFPPKNFCPICPTKKGRFETEVPYPEFDIAVFENKFPSLQSNAPKPDLSSSSFYKVKKARGICEVVVYTDKHEGTLTDLPINQIFKLSQVWKDRYIELGKRKFIKYVFIFENKGEVIGVTLNHPHGQIYAFSFLPPKIQKELSSSKKYFSKNKRCLFCDILKKEKKYRKRIVLENNRFVAFVPFYARYPYEVHMHIKKHKGSLAEFNDNDLLAFSKILKALLKKYDNLFGFSFPYMMIMHQNPADNKKYPYYHWHLEFYPPYRTAKKLKYPAGCESGAGSFINDTLAEEKARELRKAKIC